MSDSHTTPKGWKLVPIEPTYDMLRAFYENLQIDRNAGVSTKQAADCYRLMLTYAPEPPNA